MSGKRKPHVLNCEHVFTIGLVRKTSDGHTKFGQVSDLSPSPFPKGKGNKPLF